MNGFKSVFFSLTAAALFVLGASVAYANHPVLVEGNNCANGAPGTTSVPPGTCGDYDGDGLIGTAEDTDNATDRIFGTITAALAMANNGANQNGRITIVTSGRFAEQIIITAANGNVTIEAAPGVEANIDAVLSGDAGNGTRQGQSGIIVNAPSDRRVWLRNLVIRNWLTGIEVLGNSAVDIGNCRLENNVDYGILVSNSARVAIFNTQITATGFRVGATGDFPRTSIPSPGIGIEYENFSSGVVANSTITGSFGSGFKQRGNTVQLINLIQFNNGNTPLR